MSRALLILRADDFPWLSLLNNLHPLNLRILGKTLAQRWAEWSKTQGLEEVRILTEVPWTPQGAWQEEQVRQVPLGQPLPLLLSGQKHFWDKHECLVLRVPVIFHPACQPKLELQGHELEPQVLWRSRSQALDLGPWRPLTTASHFYIASLEIMETDRPPSLSPLPEGAKPPVFLDRNVKASRADLGPFALVGENTRIGAGAKVYSTVVYGNVELGAETEFREKLILGTTVVTPGTENKTTITDPKIIKALG